MSDALLQLLQATHDPSEKAAVIAESILDELPEVTALAARRCIILHWFDLPIVKALLQDIQLTESQVREAYDQLISLPFIESLSWGLTFQDLTREGLLEHYTVSRPELLRIAASLAAPVYATRKAVEAAAGEALFCYIVAGDSQASRTVLDLLLAQVIEQKDWQLGENVLQLQEEAEQLPFVEPLPPTEQDWIIRGLIHTVHGKLETAITDNSRVIEINPNNTMAYISRGNVYAEQQLYEKALSEYNSALRIDPTIFQAYIDRGVIYTKQDHYTEALVDFDHALQLAPRSIFALRNKCLVLCRLGQYEEAEAVYKQILVLDPIVFTVGRSLIFPAQQKAEQEDTALLPLVDLSHVSTFAQTNPSSAYQQLREQRATEGSKESANPSNWGPVTPFPPVLQNRGPLPKNGEKKWKNTSRRNWAILIAASLVLLLSLGSVLFFVLPSASSSNSVRRGPSTQPLSTTTQNPKLTQTSIISPHATSTIIANEGITPTPAATATPTPAATATPTPAATATPTPAATATPTPAMTETFTVPFTDGTPGVSTRNSYSGTVQITVSGAGQAATTQWSDAFYIYTDSSGNPLNPPNHASCWVMYIDSQPTNNFVSTPQYNSSHSYTFYMTAPGGPLSFGVCDDVTTDDTGSYTITVTQD